MEHFCGTKEHFFGTPDIYGPISAQATRHYLSAFTGGLTLADKNTETDRQKSRRNIWRTNRKADGQISMKFKKSVSDEQTYCFRKYPIDIDSFHDFLVFFRKKKTEDKVMREVIKRGP